MTLDGDHEILDDPNQQKEDQQQPFNFPEVNDIGMGGEEVGEKDKPIQDDGDNNDADKTVHKIKVEDGAEEDDNAPTEDDEATVETVGNEDKDEMRVDDEPQLEPEEAVPQ